MIFERIKPRLAIDEKVKNEFLEKGFIQCKEFFPRTFIEEIAPLLPRLNFFGDHYNVGESVIQHQSTDSKFPLFLNDLMNDEDILRSLSSLTGKSLSHFAGRLYRLDEKDLGFGWHQDLVNGRSLAVTVNMGIKPFIGGELIIRNRESGEEVRFHNIGPGDAVFFAIDPKFEHSVPPVIGDQAKYALAGWYHLPKK